MAPPRSPSRRVMRGARRHDACSLRRACRRGPPGERVMTDYAKLADDAATSIENLMETIAVFRGGGDVGVALLLQKNAMHSRIVELLSALSVATEFTGDAEAMRI